MLSPLDPSEYDPEEEEEEEPQLKKTKFYNELAEIAPSVIKLKHLVQHRVVSK